MGPENEIDLKALLTQANVRAQLRESYTPRMVNRLIAPLPQGVQEHLRTLFYSKELLRETWPTYLQTENQAELSIVDDAGQYGFYIGNTGQMCGVNILAGEQGRNMQYRAPIARSENDHVPQAFVPEGPYQIQLVAPAPMYDEAQEAIIHWSAHVLVMGETDADASHVNGAMTAMGLDRKPQGWMILNQGKEPGILSYALRTIPGIVLPPSYSGKESPVLGLYALQQERESQLPQDTLVGSGLVAVRYVMNFSDVNRERRSERIRAAQEAEALRRMREEELSYSSPSMTFGTKSLTGLTLGSTANMNTDRPDFSIPVGPVVMVDVTEADQGSVSPIAREVYITEHRQPDQKFPIAQSLQSWKVPYATQLAHQ